MFGEQQNINFEKINFLSSDYAEVHLDANDALDRSGQLRYVVSQHNVVFNLRFHNSTNLVLM